MLSLSTLLDLSFKSTLLLSLACVLIRSLPRASAAMRHLLLSFAFIALLFLPLLAVLMPAWRILPPIMSTNHSHVPASLLASIPAAASLSRFIPSLLPVPNHANPAPAIPLFNLSTLPALLYTLGLILFTIPLLLAALALRRLERRATQLHYAPWPELLSTIKQVIATARPITLLLGDTQTTMPMAWGLRRSRILLPHDSNIWPPERRRLVLLHELAHLKRHDPLIQTLARFIAALYWFNPLVWFTLHQLKMEAERACDDLVLTSAIPSAYASELLAIATSHRTHTRLLTAVAMARSNNKQLHTRIRWILNPALNRQSPSKKLLLLLTILLSALIVPLAMLHAAEPPANDFPQLVHFQLGDSQFPAGDNITITEIRGTSDTIAPTNTYQIKGTYTLASANHATLAAYVTSLPDADPNRHDPIDPHQSISINKGSGTFTLILPILSPGRPHLSFYPDHGQSFSALYFGTGDSLDPPAALAPAFSPGTKLTITVRDGKVHVESNGTVFEADTITFIAPATRPSR